MSVSQQSSPDKDTGNPARAPGILALSLATSGAIVTSLESDLLESPSYHQVR